jgi:hypothetical protein
MPEAAPAPKSFDRAGLEAARFIGWSTWDELRASKLEPVPHGPGAYVVSRSSTDAPSFLPTSPAGHFKGKDPSVPTERLRAEWVDGATIIYIGKADVLRRRLHQYARFGAGEPVGHWGGRLIWQLADSGELLVAWHALATTETARSFERRLLLRFGELYKGRRPFANLTG